jgi:hypothetical protein
LGKITDAVEILGKMGPLAKAAIPTLTDLLYRSRGAGRGMEDRMIRTAAAKALAAIRRQPKMVVPALVKALLKEEDFFNTTTNGDMKARRDLARQIAEIINALGAFGPAAMDSVSAIEDSWSRLGLTVGMLARADVYGLGSPEVREDDVKYNCENVNKALRRITGDNSRSVVPTESGAPAWPSVCADCGMPDPRGFYQQNAQGRRRCEACTAKLGPLLE